MKTADLIDSPAWLSSFVFYSWLTREEESMWPTTKQSERYIPSGF